VKVLNLGRKLQKDSIKRVLVFSEFCPNGALLPEALVRDMAQSATEPLTVVDVDPTLIELLQDVLMTENEVI
jgi:hypothetical protein